MIHIRCGDDMRPAFDASGLSGEYIKCADPLCEGPTPAATEGAAWQATRAGFANETYGVPLADAEQFLATQEAGLARAEDADEVVLWFEHDIFDQIILIYLLDRFAQWQKPAPKLTLICIDGFSGIDEFCGLSQLGPDALRDLYATRAEVNAEQFDLARRAWSVYRDADPTQIEILRGKDTSALPFLADALMRHLEDFPGLRDGLARTERQALMAVAGGPQSAEQVFAYNQAMEEARWCGDTMYWGWLRRLAGGRLPVLTISGPESWYLDRAKAEQTTIGLTRAGHALLNGAADLAKLAAIDRWHGGVRLSGENPAWRWDMSRRRLVAG